MPRDSRDVGSSGAVVAGNCEPPNMAAGSLT